MPEIPVTVRDKQAMTDGTPEIVCGNSDYAFVFDLDAEWDAFEVKTARFVWREAGSGRILFDDVPFEGNTALMPPVYNTDLVLAGLYAGSIHTTTPARILCHPSITDRATVHPEPDPDIYAELLAVLEELTPPAPSATIPTDANTVYFYVAGAFTGVCETGLTYSAPEVIPAE